MRYEDSTDVESALVGKFAVGWDINDIFKFRASISTAYRAPNIIQVNEKIVVRTGTRNDYSFYRLQQANGISTSSSNLDSRYSMQRQATGAENLKSEESDNTSVGFVLTPVDGLTITADYWTIEKKNTIGLFGRNNHTVYDMMLRWANGTNNCGSFVGNPAVVREAPDSGDVEDGYFAVAGVCPFGVIKYVGDNYLNLATRTIEGYDIGIYYDVDTDFGDFAVRYIGSFIDKFEQVPGGEFAALAAQQAAGQIPADIPIDGFGDLLGQNGNYDEKHRLRVTWSKGSWGASLTGLRKGDFYQSSLTRSDGTRFVIPSMTVFDVTVDYKFSIRGSGNSARIRFAVKNAADERAPTADRYYGYFADAHTDLGRNFYVDFRVSL
jgi:outer membrane receptor protein involved in Fe transport